MANDKSGRKKLVEKLTKTIITIILAILVAFFGTTVTTEIPSETTEPTNQEVGLPTEKVDGQLIVHMIDVGQADCFLLIQDGKTALVDCGTRSTGKDAVAYLQNLGISKLDYVIGTHPHDDHMGGMYDILTSFNIGKVIIPNAEDGEITANWYLKLMNEIVNSSYDLVYPEQGDVLELGDAVLQVLAAETDVGDNTNNYSIVLKVSFGQMDMIMTGDAETEIEEIILESGVDIDAEILKMGHHGSDTSSSAEFLDAISPEYALISSKIGNKYEHPIKTTMDKLKERRVKVYRTDECGSVIITITEESVTFNCEPGDYLSGVELEERESK